ncbi:substrate-binding domain-containing protein [Arthrobacter sp. R1-13]
MKQKLGAISVLAAATLLLGACSGTGGRPVESGASGGGQVASTERIKVAFITHAGPGDTFWDVVRKGAEEAAAKDNVELLYTADPEGGKQAQLVQQAIDQKVAGIAVTLAKPDALRDVLKKAQEAGIPVVSINSGADVFAEVGAFTHFGSDEKQAGRAVGERLAAEGIQHPVCMVHEQGNVGLEDRCAGIKEKLPATENLYVQGTDMTQVESTLTAKIQATSSADVVVALGAPFTVTSMRVVESTGNKVKVASVDISADLAQAILDDKLLFGVDQQPWLQGYGAVDALWQNKRGGFKIGGGAAVLTGPSIIDKTNAKDVIAFGKEGIR